MTSNNNSTDDGSLSFLNIQPDEANKHFNCPETTQQVQERRPRKRSEEVLHKFQRDKIHFAGDKEA